MSKLKKKVIVRHGNLPWSQKERVKMANVLFKSEGKLD